MKLSIEKSALINYLSKQLELFYPDGVVVKDGLIHIMPTVIERMDYCFSHINKKYYIEDGQSCFNHLNADHYAMFLYFVSNEAWRQNLILIATKAFLLNKALHGIDVFYSISLPNIFLFVHPIGTVLGNASYADFLVVYQHVTVGSDVGGVYPHFGKGCVLYSKSSAIGQCNLGSNVSLAAHSFIRNREIPDNTVVVGLFPDNNIKKNNRNNQQDFFGIPL